LNTTLAIIGLAGSVALLLWGTHMVQTGVQRAFGPHLRAFLSQTLRNRLAAFAAGIGITVAVQSSTATTLMAANFAAGGLVDLVPAMAIVLGANVGTALIVTVLSFNAVVLSAPLLLLGVVLFRTDSNPTSHDLGRVFIGLGLMLLALHQMLAALEPIAQSTDALTILGVLGSMPVVAIVLGAVAAWAVHSSVAVVLLIASLAGHGVVGIEPALMLVLGANLGTAINPLLESTGGKDAMSRRLPMANLGNRCFGLIVAGVFMPVILDALPRFGVTAGTAVAMFHLAFNLVLCLAMLPLLGPIATLLKRLLPEQADPTDPSKSRYLDDSAREVPSVALAGAAREALRLADALELMLSNARDAVTSSSRRRISATQAQDDVLDSINTAIRHYLAGFESDALSEVEERRLHQILVFATNMEQAGDVISGNLLPHASKRLKRGLLPSQDHEAELVAMMDRLILNTRKAASLFMTEDAHLARDLAEEKLVFRRAEYEATSNHFARMRDGIGAASQSEGLQVDLMRDMKLINSHIVAAAAYPVLERTGQLLPMRLAGSTGLE
jgi:phosphate:Na+ symporter